MFISVKRSGYTRDGEQFCQGQFLILMQPKSEYLWIPYYGAPDACYMDINGHYPVRGIVRYVSMRQCGHFMMAWLRICACNNQTTCGLCAPKDGNAWKTRLCLSGAYGSDGLICSVPMPFYQKGIVLPEDLYQAWAKGNGWNSAGNEAPLLRQWAKQTFKR